ncbi:MAG: dodecin domain-containing protein [Actinobacteria bacterium]|nr:dodecin domain-containing protein [Actinomycetota bacterium]
MSVEKSIDLTATGPSIEEAVTEAVHRASLTLRGVTGFEVERVEGMVDDGAITYKVLLRLTFVIKEQVHE